MCTPFSFDAPREGALLCREERRSVCLCVGGGEREEEERFVVCFFVHPTSSVASPMRSPRATACSIRAKRPDLTMPTTLPEARLDQFVGTRGTEEGVYSGRRCVVLLGAVVLFVVCRTRHAKYSAHVWPTRQVGDTGV